MFGRLKKSLRDSIGRIAGKVEEPGAGKEGKRIEKKVEKRVGKGPEKRHDRIKKPKTKEKPAEETIEELIEEPEPVEEIKEDVEEEPAEEEKEKRGFLGLGRKLTTRRLTGRDIDDFFDESESDFMSNNVAVEVIDFFRRNLKERLEDRPIKRTQASGFVAGVFRDTLFEVVDQGEVDLDRMIREKKKEKKPLLMVFLGFNGSGKTTSISKVARYFTGKGKKVVLAAGDTFRAASIEQLEVHGKKLGLRVIKHQYGSDSAAVVFDAVRFAEANGQDVVLADTAGRIHTDKNLMDELRKVIRVNRPDLKVIVVDSLTGNDAVEQAKKFHEAVGVDAVMMTKTDVNPKGGSILSVCYAIKKPILFIGTGQGYGDIVKFDPKKFVKDMLS